MDVDIKLILPWMGLAAGAIGIITYVSTRDNRIAEQAASDTQTTIALSALKGDISELSTTFKQSIVTLKDQQWMEHGRTETRLGKVEAKHYSLEEEIDGLRLQALENENARLRAMLNQ